MYKIHTVLVQSQLKATFWWILCDDRQHDQAKPFYGLNKIIQTRRPVFLVNDLQPIMKNNFSVITHIYGRKHPHIHKAHTHTHKEKRFHTASCCAESVPAMQPRGNGEVMGRAKIQLPTQPLICLCIPLSRWRGTRGATIHLTGLTFGSVCV